MKIEEPLPGSLLMSYLLLSVVLSSVIHSFEEVNGVFLHGSLIYVLLFMWHEVYTAGEVQPKR